MGRPPAGEHAAPAGEGRAEPVGGAGPPGPGPPVPSPGVEVGGDGRSGLGPRGSGGKRGRVGGFARSWAPGPHPGSRGNGRLLAGERQAQADLHFRGGRQLGGRTALTGPEELCARRLLSAHCSPVGPAPPRAPAPSGTPRPPQPPPAPQPPSATSSPSQAPQPPQLLPAPPRHPHSLPATPQ